MRADTSMLTMRSLPGVRDGFEIFTRALEARLTAGRAMELLSTPNGDGGDGFDFERTTGALFAAVAILDRAAAYGARPSFRRVVPDAIALPFVLRGKARVAALEQLPKGERAAMVAAMLKAAALYASWLMKRDGELPGDMEEPVPIKETAAEPPAPLKLEWPAEPMRMEVVKVPPTVARSTVERGEGGRIESTVVTTIQAG